MKRAIVIFGLLLWTCQGMAQSDTVRVAVLDTPAGHSHSDKVIEVIGANYSGACSLDVGLFAIYEQGNLTIESFRWAVQESQRFSPDITNISWNTIYRKPYEGIVRELENVSRAGFLVVAAVDDATPNDGGSPSGTVMGNVSGALVIGALSEDGMPTSDSFQEELFTAVPPPEGTLGSSFSAALFTAKLAERVCQDGQYDVYRQAAVGKELPTLDEILRE